MTFAQWVRPAPRPMACSMAVTITLNAVRELEPGGELSTTKTYPFEFNNVEMPYESYNGVNVRLK